MTREQWIVELGARRYKEPQQMHLHSNIKLTLDEAIELENLLRTPIVVIKRVRSSKQRVRRKRK